MLYLNASCFRLLLNLRRFQSSGSTINNKCDVCNQSFTQKSTVKTHMLVHTGRKNFQCEVCEKKFLQKSHLKQHMLIHTKVKAHECDICKKKFSLRSNLVQHFRIHLGEQPYGCAKCEKWFTGCSNRNKHIRTHTELSIEQQSELKCEIPRSIVHDYLNYINDF